MEGSRRKQEKEVRHEITRGGGRKEGGSRARAVVAGMCAGGEGGRRALEHVGERGKRDPKKGGRSIV